MVKNTMPAPKKPSPFMERYMWCYNNIPSTPGEWPPSWDTTGNGINDFRIRDPDWELMFKLRWGNG